MMIENDQYYESTIKTSRINNKLHKTKWKKSWAILNNEEIITTTPTSETKDLRCKFVSAKDYLDLYKKLEEKNKIIDEILNHDYCFPYECPLEAINNDDIQDIIEKICNCDNCKDDKKNCWLKYFKNKVKERGKNG